jgi:hypothetical protein
METVMCFARVGKISWSVCPWRVFQGYLMFVSKARVVIHKSIIFFTRVRYPESDHDNLGKPYVHLTHPHPKKDGKNYWKSLVHDVYAVAAQ